MDFDSNRQCEKINTKKHFGQTCLSVCRMDNWLEISQILNIEYLRSESETAQIVKTVKNVKNFTKNTAKIALNYKTLNSRPCITALQRLCGADSQPEFVILRIFSM